jgi:starch-binding outer membrane protein, SusD/RagB family
MIMKCNYIKSIFVVILVLAGCSKDLDLSPKDTISDATFWKTPADYQVAANNLYNSLPGLNYDDTESDIAFNNPNAVSNGTYQLPETDGNWNNAYAYIRRCNNIIEKASSSPIAGDVKRYAAEAKFFRAFNYWQLFRRYGGVPLILKVLDIGSEELYSPRATWEGTVSLILKDLTEAAVDLPESKDLSASEKGRITKGAANALKARVALFEGTWSKYHDGANTDADKYLDLAIEASKNVINSEQYSLYTGSDEESYRYLFIEQGDDSPENILDRRYERLISEHTFPQDVQQIGYLPTKKLADMYLCSDGLPVTRSSLFQGYDTRVSEFQNRDPRMTMTMLIPGTVAYQALYWEPVENWPFYPQRNANMGYILYKYISEDVNSLNHQGGYTGYDHHIIRYAEVLLIYAEAIFERNGSISDNNLNKSINVIRQRVNMPPLTNAFVESNGLDMKEEIRRERTIELALEGFRYDDLRRWKTAEAELPKAIKGVKIKGTDWTDPIIIEGANRNPYAQEYWQNKTDEDGFIVRESASERTFDPAKHYLRPLPTREIFINPDLEQNPNW